jgi:hypothetical protein
MGASNVGSALDALRLELREVERQLAEYDALRRRRERLLNAIDATEAVEAMRDEVQTPAEELRSVVQRVVLRAVPSDHPPTPSEAAMAILKEVASPLHIRDLIRLIQAKGWFTNRTYEQLRATIAGTLDQRASRADGGIAKPGRGTYLWVVPDPVTESLSIAPVDPALGEFADQWRATLGVKSH